MRPDAVIPYLSSRQTLILAAVAEAVVAIALRSSISPTYKAFTLIWLTLVFSLYRWLWWSAMATNEPCPCFGFFFQYFHVDARIGNRISMAVLGYFIIVASLVLRHTHCSTTRRHAMRPRTSASLTPVLMTGLLAALPGTLDAQGGNATTMQGMGRCLYLTSHREFAFKFTVLCEPGRILIQTFGSENPDVLGSTFMYQAGEGVTIVSLDPSRLAPTLGTNPVSKVPMLDSNRLAKPFNDGNMAIRASPIPSSSSPALIGIWLALGSKEYFHGISNRCDKLFDLNWTERSGHLIIPCQLDMEGRGPWPLKSLLTFTEQGGLRTTNEHFRVSQWQDDDGVSIPIRFEYGIYESHRPPLGKLLTIFGFTITNTLHSNIFNTPTIAGNIWVNDGRFADDVLPLRNIDYWVTNGVIPSKKWVKSSNQYRSAESEEIGRIGTRHKMVRGVLFCIAGIPPALAGWWWVSSVNRRSIAKSTNI